MTVADDNIFRSLTDAPAVLVAPWFDSDAIVTNVEIHTFYQYIGAGFRVAAVIIVIVAVDIYIPYGYVVAKYGMNDPEGRIVNF